MSKATACHRWANDEALRDNMLESVLSYDATLDRLAFVENARRAEMLPNVVFHRLVHMNFDAASAIREALR